MGEIDAVLRRAGLSSNYGLAMAGYGLEYISDLEQVPQTSSAQKGSYARSSHRLAPPHSFESTGAETLILRTRCATTTLGTDVIKRLLLPF
jgi:hypothetical protein